ncbi:deoxyribose-phosphate aldolase [Pollutibacter soli]|uniref:deoxyribose-phosphate aldolase n=1 Tax=Pollutibacter soli TaxID=3034157 RepID=UPI003013B1BE
MKYTVAQLAGMIDHSLLHPTMTSADLEKGCAIAAKAKTASVCIKPYAVEKAAEWLAGSGVLVCTVVGFPHGSNLTSIKVEETIKACEEGATEIDMVVNIGKVLGEEWDYVSAEIQAIQAAATGRGAIIKVIFEIDYLQEKHKIKLCKISSDAGVAFVKTSTGYGYVKNADGHFATKGATPDDVRLMRKYSSPNVGVKAAGGIRTLADMLYIIECGATRIGATATETMLSEAAKVISGELQLNDLQKGSGGY